VNEELKAAEERLRVLPCDTTNWGDNEKRVAINYITLRLAADQDALPEMQKLRDSIALLEEKLQSETIFRLSLAEKCAELESYCEAFVPDPTELSGWDDDGCEPHYADLIRLACKWHGVEEPRHITTILEGGGE
jgi:hypothetical protein